jgi:hypothetical protein
MFPLAALYMKDGRFEKSKEVLSELLTSDPGHQDAANLLEELEHNLAKTAQGPQPSQNAQEPKSDER